MIKCQFPIGISAILAYKLVSQEQIEPGKGRMPLGPDILLQTDHTWQLHLKRWGGYSGLIFRHDIHPLEKDSLDGILPRPQR